MARHGDVTARRLIPADAEHRRTLEAVRRALRSRLPFDEVSPHRLTSAGRRLLRGADLVVTVGGDGTVLAASHYVTEGALLGVNSAPADSVGHFCLARRSNVAETLTAILEGRLRPVELARLRLALDGRRVPEPALNDLLITHESPAATSRYVLRVRGTEEEHRSSGIWIATAAGSTAGIRSAGGRAMRPRSRQFQYRVRELYREPGRSYRLDHGLIAPGATIEVASKMREARIYVDGARLTYSFPFGTRAVIGIAAEPLRIFLAPPREASRVFPGRRGRRPVTVEQMNVAIGRLHGRVE